MIRYVGRLGIFQGHVWPLHVFEETRGSVNTLTLHSETENMVERTQAVLSEVFLSFNISVFIRSTGATKYRPQLI